MRRVGADVASDLFEIDCGETGAFAEMSSSQPRSAGSAFRRHRNGLDGTKRFRFRSDRGRSHRPAGCRAEIERKQHRWSDMRLDLPDKDRAVGSLEVSERCSQRRLTQGGPSASVMQNLKSQKRNNKQIRHAFAATDVSPTRRGVGDAAFLFQFKRLACVVTELGVTDGVQQHLYGKNNIAPI